MDKEMEQAVDETIAAARICPKCGELASIEDSALVPAGEARTAGAPLPVEIPAVVPCIVLRCACGACDTGYITCGLVWTLEQAAHCARSVVQQEAMDPFSFSQN